jgi:3-isopropylmalate/(R)-2-methylmalate dehydratase small subunit
MNKFTGRVRRLGDNIDTDLITPVSVLELPIEEIKKHAFAPLFPEFYQTVKEGDVLVAGSNFGCGSSREQATAVVKELGIRFIVCESMARIYLRNCIALGLYPVLSEGVSRLFEEGDEIEIDLTLSLVRNTRTGQTAPFEPLTGMPREILENGGIMAILKKKIFGERSIVNP